MGFEIVGDRLVKYIEEDGVKNVIIPDGVRIIGEEAFYGCCEIESILIPESVKIIEKAAFGDSSAMDFTFHDNMEKIEKSVFWGSNILELKMNGKKISITFSDRHYDRIYFLLMSDKIIEFVCSDTDRKEEIVFEEIKDNDEDNYYEKVLFVIYLFFEYESKRAADYIDEHSEDIAYTLIYFNNHEFLAMIMPYLHIDKSYLDKCISFAIKSQRTEIQLILSNYKNDNFDFANGFDDLLL